MIAKPSSIVPLHGFEVLEGVAHYVATRNGGVSSGEFGSLNVSLGTADRPEAVLENRRRIAESMAISPDRLVFARQSHGERIAMATPEWLQLPALEISKRLLQDTDAMISNVPGLCLSVITADCVPILLYDPVNQAIGAVHAGWRGTVALLAAKTVRAMQQAYGTDPADVLAGIGPSIGPEVYEVGAEVLQAAERAFGTLSGLAVPKAGGKGLFNLWEANRRQLQEAGLRPANIEIAGICTLSTPEHFFSARHYQGNGGRFASGIYLPDSP